MLQAALKAKSPVVGIHLPDGTVFPVDSHRLQKTLAGLQIRTVSLAKIERDRITLRKVILSAGTEVLEVVAGNGKFRFVRVKNAKSIIVAWAQKQRDCKPITLPKGELARLKLALADEDGWVDFTFYNHQKKVIVESKGVPVYLGILPDWEFLADYKDGEFCVREALSGMSVGKGRNLPTLLKEIVYCFQNLSAEKLAEIPQKIAAELEVKFNAMCEVDTKDTVCS